MNSQQVIELFERYVIGNYRRFPVCLVRGEGSYVWDAEGRRYLDFFPGWGCNLLGHCPRRVVEAVCQQVATLIHVPNTWYTEPQGRWAQLLSERSFGGKAFFCNSGAEAVEAAIKLARAATPKGRYKIVSFDGSFHGRTFAALSATAQAKYHEGFEPLVPGFVYAPWGDLDTVAELVDDQTAAIIVEPVQGEGGIRIAAVEFLRGLRHLADERGLLLIFDEVQTGCGRTGKWFAYQHYDVVPDIMTLSKGVCGGIAGGVMLAKPEVAAYLRPGMHASTFGGNPIAARAGIATIEMIEAEGLLDRVEVLSQRFRQRLEELARHCPLVREVRVLGLMIGIELHVPGSPIVQACLDRGLLINCTHDVVLRLLPAMTLTEAELDQGCDILEEVLLQFVHQA